MAEKQIQDRPTDAFIPEGQYFHLSTRGFVSQGKKNPDVAFMVTIQLKSGKVYAMRVARAKGNPAGNIENISTLAGTINREIEG